MQSPNAAAQEDFRESIIGCGRKDLQELTVAFNPNYLADGLAAATGETVKVEVRDGLKPGIVRGDDDAFTYLVMPVRLPAPVS